MAKLAVASAEVSKHREDALIEVSRLQASAETIERKIVEVAEEVATAKPIILFEYQSSTKFE